MGLDNTCGIAHLHGCGDPSVQARACARVARSGTDPRGDAVEQLGGGCAKRSERFKPHRAKVIIQNQTKIK